MLQNDGFYTGPLLPSRSLMNEERCEQFVKGFITLSQLQGLTRKDLYSIAQYAYDQFRFGRIKDALTIFEGLVALNPSDAYFQSCLGSVYQRLGRYDEAIARYAIALSKNPKDLRAMLNRGECYFKLGKLAKARRELMQMAKMDLEHKNQLPLIRRARILVKLVQNMAKQIKLSAPNNTHQAPAT